MANGSSEFELENLWEALLSRQPEQVRKAFAGLQAAERQSVREHLNRMATEPGWHPEQRLSAQAALEALSTV
jgi:hypothetical protein